MSYLQNITHYFKQSLIDSDRLSPDDKVILPLITEQNETKRSKEYLLFSRQQWALGKIKLEVTDFIFAQKKVPASQESVELFLFPRVDAFKVEGSHSSYTSRRILVPLCVFVTVNRKGELSPSSMPPWIPREWMSPNASTTQPFTDFSAVDTYLTQNPYEHVNTWDELVRYCENFLKAVTAPEDVNENSLEKFSIYDSPFIDNPIADAPVNKSLHDIAIHPNYSVTTHGVLQLELPVIGAKAKIIGVLESMLKEKEFPPLYKRFVSNNNSLLQNHVALTQAATSEKQHIAQMTGEFPLSEHQRNSLHYFFQQQSGEILAINGPPGTGKTTLLRSVVANMWTAAALKEEEPPLIFAASNNNQAVTNILESFAKIEEEGIEPSLKGRWLPKLESYGLYCCSSALLNKTPHLDMNNNGDGRIKEFLDKNYVDEAIVHFLKKSSEWAGESFESLETAQIKIHQKLKSTTKLITNIIDEKEQYLEISKEILHSYESLKSLIYYIKERQEKRQVLSISLQHIKNSYDKIQELWSERSIWIHLFLWISSLRKVQQRKTERLFCKLIDEADLETFSDDAVDVWFRNKLKEIFVNQSTVEKEIQDAEKLLGKFQASCQKIRLFLNSHNIKLMSHKLLDQISEVLDRGLRFTAFKLATHYWESRWLTEALEFLRTPDAYERSPRALVARYHRHAKLTPCFVSTFYMLPSLLTAWKGEDKPLYSTADLLVVDEAGQALAEVSAASFALAKKALVVGDTDQIEPVWSIPEKVDIANLEKFCLLDENYENFWKKSGLLASSGNVMRIAQRQSTIHQYEKLSRGLYLTEHRRCFNPIISYCNDLVYQGILKPLRGQPKTTAPWPMLGFQSVNSTSLSQGGSRINEGEAKAIVSWIVREKTSILQYAVSQNPSWKTLKDLEILKKSVAIVTPFSRQAKKISQYLADANISNITVGTVHKLQGDERLIVLFSSVYGSADIATGKFYDRGCNMLNVAVSRAKDSFIVFGHKDVFGIGAKNSPSGLLRSKLTPINTEIS